jgi:DNA-binding NarL/FixJ family response regulator
MKPLTVALLRATMFTNNANATVVRVQIIFKRKGRAMPGEILICAAAMMAYGMRAALLALMPELKCRICRGDLVANIETFAHLVSAQRPQMTIFDADSVAVRAVLEALGKGVLAPFGAPDVQGMLGKIVVLTTKPDGEDLFALAKYGARAYVSGCLPACELAHLVQNLLTDDQLYLLDSRTFADPDLALIAKQRLQVECATHVWQEAVPEDVAPEDDAEKPLFTDLELRLLRGLSCGMSTHVAARHAGISYWYAKGLIPAVTQKLQAKNRTGAVLRAWQLGLIDLPETEMILRYADISSRQTGTPDERASGLERRQVVATN